MSSVFIDQMNETLADVFDLPIGRKENMEALVRYTLRVQIEDAKARYALEVAKVNALERIASSLEARS